jgi:AGZA family xanthine/uracil permease-like MFS transporter
MGHNVFFAFTVCGTAAGGFGLTWQQGLTAVAFSGLIFLLLARFGFRSAVLNSIPDSLRQAIAAGIGLFIALIGLKYANVIVPGPIGLQLGHMSNPIVGIALFGLLVTLTLMALRVPAALLLGMFATLLLSLFTGYTEFKGVFDLPPAPAAFALDISGFFGRPFVKLATIVFILFFLDLFDTVGTLVGVATRAGWMKDGKLPRAERALTADAMGTVAGACLGTSTVTSYIESATGVAAGARTGFANLITAGLFLLALFCSPLVEMIGGGVEIAKGAYAYPLIAPAMIVVGALMMQGIRQINWDDVTEGLPAFLTLVVIPFAFSISDGIAFGFVSYAAIKTLTGRWRECPIIVYIFAVLFVVEYTVLR